MPLTYGQKMALYVLLMEHSGNADGKPELRRAVDDAITSGSTPQSALQAQALILDPTIDTAAIGAFTLSDPASLRGALGLDYTGGSCPPGPDTLAIYNAINAMP